MLQPPFLLPGVEENELERLKDAVANGVSLSALDEFERFFDSEQNESEKMEEEEKAKQEEEEKKGGKRRRKKRLKKMLKRRTKNAK